VSLRVTEIFHSLQGEGLDTGLPTTFVRLTGCPLRCSYCDTTYAFKGGRNMAPEAVCRTVQQFGCRRVTLTGGEPLAQKQAFDLVRMLCDQGHSVAVETSGAVDIAPLDSRARVVMDIKTPASGEAHRNLWQNLQRLRPQDQLKFVICNRDDYLWSREQLHRRHLQSHCTVLFSPAWDRLEPTQLAEWILEDGLEVRFQLQLHKVLWGEEPGR